MASPPTQFAPSWCKVSGSNRVLLSEAAYGWQDTDRSNRSIQQALASSDVELEVLVSAYRYYFYRNDDRLALEMAITVVDRVRQQEQWPDEWKVLKPMLQDRLDDPTVRLYVNAYAASALVLARLGRLDEARTIAEQVQQLNAKEFGSDVLLSILNPSPEED